MEQLRRRVTATLAIKMIAAATTYAFMFLLARLMAPAEFGQIAFFLNASLFLSVVGAGGQQMALLRFVPTLKDVAELPALVDRSARLAGLVTMTVLVATVCILLAARSTGHLAGFTVLILWLGPLLIAAVGWADFQAHLARGMSYIVPALLPKEVLWRLLAAIAVVALSVFGTGQVTAITVMLILLAALASLNIGQLAWLFRRLPRQTNKTPRVRDQWRSAAAPFWITSVSNIFLANADVIVVGAVLGAEAAGYYFAANRLAMLLAFVMTSHNIVIAPMLSEAKTREDIDEISQIVGHTTRRTTAATVAIGLVLILFAAPILTIFGDEFPVAADALRLLVLAGIVNAATGPADILLNMGGLERPAMRAAALALLVSIVLLVTGGIIAGATGVAASVLLATAFRKGLFWTIAAWRMGIRTDIFAGMRPALNRANEAGA